MTSSRRGGHAAPFRSDTSEPGLGLLWLVLLEGWLERRRQRLALRALNDHLLRDIGVSRADAAREASKPFWRR